MRRADSLPAALAAMLRRDLRIAYRRRGEGLHPVLFFVVVVALFPLAASLEPGLLARIAPAVLWVAALLANLLALDALFRADHEDGALEQWLLSPHPTAALALVRVAAHWLATGAPLVLVSPLLAEML
ncbi:MAG: heme exporter protein CcmB, partial [bacterium]